MARSLKPGDELHCPHCGDWHPIFAPNTEGTPATVEGLYWECGARPSATRAALLDRWLRRRPRQTLDVLAQPQIVRHTDGRELLFIFMGVIDADGFAVYEEQSESPENRA